MENIDSMTTNDKSLRFAALAYSTILLAAMGIGLYGLLSLLRLAGPSMGRAAHLGLVF